jgi:hypothetical protein
MYQLTLTSLDDGVNKMLLDTTIILALCADLKQSIQIHLRLKGDGLCFAIRTEKRAQICLLSHDHATGVLRGCVG